MMKQLRKAVGLIILFSFHISKVSAQTEYLVKIDQATGVHTKINSLPGVNWIWLFPRYLTFDENKHRYFFRGSSDTHNWNLYSVDANTGNILSSIPFPVLSDTADNVIELQYDNASDILYALHWDASEDMEYFVSVNPTTGAFTKINSLPGVKWIMPGYTTYDKVNHRFLFRGSPDAQDWLLYSIDALTGNIISNPLFPALYGPPIGNIYGLHHDNILDMYYALYWDYPENMEFLVSVDPATGLFTKISSLPEVNSIGTSTYDEIHHHYIFYGVDNNGKIRLYTVGVNNGNTIYNPPFPVTDDPVDNVIEYKYDNAAGILYALHWDANDPAPPPTTGLSGNQLNHPLFNLYPNPFTTGSKITLDKSYREITVFIYNSVGQVVGKETVFNTSTVAIQRGALASGTYFVSVICDHKNIGVKKIVAK